MYIKRIFSNIILYLITGTLQDKALRIIGGRDAAPEEFPYVVKMEIKQEKEDSTVHYSHLCTGILLKSTWSMTAGHCITGLLDELSLLPLAKGIIKYNISIERESPYGNILSTFLHPNFNEPDNSLFNLYSDVGLLLSEKITVSTFGKLSPVDYLTLYGSKVLALGFGITKAANGSFGDAHSVKKPLQVLDVIITRCPDNIFYPSFCLGGLCGTSSRSLCPGDSGGPVLHATGLVGINTGSYFNICNEKNFQDPGFKFKNFAGIITPGSPFIDWVMNVIKSNS